MNINFNAEDRTWEVLFPDGSIQEVLNSEEAAHKILDGERTQFVTIPAQENHDGYAAVKVRLFWTCPTCGGPRGEVHDARSYDGSRILYCDGWENPCGHVDKYSAIRKEAWSNGLNSF